MTTSHTEDLLVGASVVGVRRWGHLPPQVVLLHGAGGNRDSLELLGDRLHTAGLPVAALSLPGRVGSAGAPCTSAGQAAVWLRDVMGTLAPDGAILLGHSFGGGVAIETALGAPAAARAWLKGLVLVATGARLRVHPTILEGIDAAAAGRGGNHAELSTAGLRPDASEALRRHVVAATERTPATAAAADWHAADRFDRLEDLANLDVPVLVIGADDDWLTPPTYAHYLADHIPEAALVLLEGAGHWFPVEQAGAVTEAVVPFVQRVLADRAG
jgi:pimeloyl-ACP methyl ester carboxylesterase